MPTVRTNKDGLDGFDPWELLGDPSAYGLIDWSSIPGWDMPTAPVDLGETPSIPGWGGGAGGDGTNGSPTAPGASGGMPAWLSQIGRFLGIGGGSGSGAGAGAGGLGGLGALIPLIAGIYGGVNAHGATQDARDAMLAANTEARDLVSGQLAQSGGAFKPYSDAGATGLQRLLAMPPSDLASRYRPLGSGRGMSFAQLGRGGK